MAKPQVEVTVLSRESGTERDRRFTVLGSGLHCGEGLDLVVQDKVLKGRVEYSNWLGWYWVWNDREYGTPYMIPLVIGMLVALPK